MNIYIVYELSFLDSNENYPVSENFSFGAVKLLKNSGYGIGFDRRGTFSFPTSGFGCSVTIFGADMSYSIHLDIKTK